VLTNLVWGTPSTQIWNPSTDVKTTGGWHMDIDNYFSIVDNETKPYASGTYMGLTYGLIKNMEVGIDLMQPSANPVYLNVKYGVPEDGSIPAIAVGVFNMGTKTDVTNYNIFYALVARNINKFGRLSVGGYTGNEKLLVDETGEKVNTGLILSWDKALTEKVWASIDYASGNNVYGCLTAGFSYAFSSNISVIFGYVIYNNDKLNLNNQMTTQVDINF
jgi:hypothetical protein